MQKTIRNLLRNRLKTCKYDVKKSDLSKLFVCSETSSLIYKNCLELLKVKTMLKMCERKLFL